MLILKVRYLGCQIFKKLNLITCHLKPYKVWFHPTQDNWKKKKKKNLLGMSVDSRIKEIWLQISLYYLLAVRLEWFHLSETYTFHLQNTVNNGVSLPDHGDN